MSKMGVPLCLRCMSPIGKGASCSQCGWEDDAVYDLQYARPGMVLSGRYLLGVSLRKNGEGALYAGYDLSLQQKVWIREYFPRTIAQRALETGKISPLAGCGAQYKALMSDFVDICNEIRRLGVTEPVVPLENVISENNTVYAIFRGLELISFEEYLEQQGGKISHRQALSMLLPICNALGTVHAHGHIHRGISPHTLFVDQEGHLLLWDFALSATRTAGSELDAELFAGYSAPEQYSPSGWQGSWTDVYAMAALFYRAVTGIVPPRSNRVNQDRPLAPLSDLVPHLPQNISDGVRDAMYPDTRDRTQTTQTFVSQLIEPKASATAVYDTSKVVQANEEVQRREKEGRERRGGGTAKFVFLGMLVMLLLLGGVVWLFWDIIDPVPVTPDSMPDVSSSEPEAPEQNPDSDLNHVPEFFGRMYGDVTNHPDYSRFDFKKVEEFSDDYPEGTVIDQYPVEKTEIPAEGRIQVELTVSKGPVRHEMPDMIGKTLDDALEELQELQGVSVDIIPVYDSNAKPNEVIRTTPEAGAEFDPKRQTVYIFYMQEVSMVEGSSRPSSSSRNDDEITLDRESSDDRGLLFRND